MRGIIAILAIDVIMITILFILDVMEAKFGVLLPMIIALIIIIKILGIAPGNFPLWLVVAPGALLS